MKKRARYVASELELITRFAQVTEDLDSLITNREFHLLEKLSIGGIVQDPNKTITYKKQIKIKELESILRKLTQY